MRPERLELPLRIAVVDPVPGLALALQRGASGKTALVAPVAESAGVLTFDLDVTVDGALADGRPRFLGPYVQGPPTERFVYVCVRQGGGGPIGRMKVPLRDLDWPLIDARPPAGRVEGRVSGRGPKGKPALATVPILPPGWTVVNALKEREAR